MVQQPGTLAFTIVGTTAEEVRSKILELAKMLHVDGASIETAAGSSQAFTLETGKPIVGAEDDTPKSKPPEGVAHRRGRKPLSEEEKAARAKARAQAAAPKPMVDDSADEQAAEPVVAATQSVDIDDVKKMLFAVNDKHGADTARKLLADCGADRLSALKPECYADFMDMAMQLVSE